MNKRKIAAFSLGATAVAVGGIYAVVKKIYTGSKFLWDFSDKVDVMKPNIDVKLEEDGYYSITKNSDSPIRILQLTDMHIGGGYLSRHEDYQAMIDRKSVV